MPKHKVLVVEYSIIQKLTTNFAGNCELEGVSQSQWKGSYTNQKVNDYERLLFKVFKTKNVIGMFFNGWSETVALGGILKRAFLHHELKEIFYYALLAIVKICRAIMICFG